MEKYKNFFVLKIKLRYKIKTCAKKRLVYIFAEPKSIDLALTLLP